MTKTLYGVYNHNSETIVAGKFSREEMYAFIECEGQSCDTGIHSGDDGTVWYFIAGGEVPSSTAWDLR